MLQPLNFTSLKDKFAKVVSAWIGFHVPIAQAKELAVIHGFEPMPADKLHLTLLYLPEIERLKFDVLARDVSEWARYRRPITGMTAGIIRFDSHQNNDDADAVCAHFDCPALPEFRGGLYDYIVSGGWQVAKNHGFTPHITLDYVPDGVDLVIQKVPLVEITFSEVVVSSSELERDVTLRLGGDLQLYYPWGGGNTTWASGA